MEILQLVTDTDTGVDLSSRIVYEAEDLKGLTVIDSTGKKVRNGNCSSQPGEDAFTAPITITRDSRAASICLNAYDIVEEYKGIIAGKTLEFQSIPKSKNTIIAKARTVTVSYSKLKKKDQTIAAGKAITVTDAKGKVSYNKTGGSGKLAIAKNGKITVSKGLKKGNYKIKVKVTAAGNSDYKSGSVSVTATITVK